MHGSTQTAADFAAGTELNVLADRIGAYVLYPEQSPLKNHLRSWNWFRSENQTRDGEVAAILDLVESVSAGHPIDRSRIFVVGISSGAAMAAILAEQAPDVFAGAGIVAGVPLHVSHNVSSALAAMRGETDAPSLTRPAGKRYGRMRVTIWTGTEDTVVAPDNAWALARQFCELFNLDPARSETQHQEGARIERWRDALGRVRIELRELEGIGHAWSGGSDRGSYTQPGPSASIEILKFFFPDAAREIEGKPPLTRVVRERIAAIARSLKARLGVTRDSA